MIAVEIVHSAPQSNRNVFMFPGQSSRNPTMIEKILAKDPPSRAIVTHASAVLGRDLAAHYRSSNARIFDRNCDVQVGVFLASYLHCKLVERRGVVASWSLGLSLGEYNHLVHIGALSFETALKLVDARGLLYDQGPRGLMVSIFPLDAATIESVIKHLDVGRQVVLGLRNSPTQQVISGERDAVERVIAALDEETLISAIEIEQIPMHAPAFCHVASQFRKILDQVSFETPKLPYVPNARAVILDHPDPAVIRECLVEHVSTPVHWQRSVDTLAESVAGARFVEVGPGTVLFNLFGRGWMPGSRARTDNEEEWDNHLTSLVTQLCDGA
jgi:[acyl-carrier-protein] S-malonyltransferase